MSRVICTHCGQTYFARLDVDWFTCEDCGAIIYPNAAVQIEYREAMYLRRMGNGYDL